VKRLSPLVPLSYSTRDSLLKSNIVEGILLVSLYQSRGFGLTMFIDQVESALFGIEEDFGTFWRRHEAFELFS
jgi:hypothetical protein